MGSDKSGQPNYVQPKIICSFVPIHLTVYLSIFYYLWISHLKMVRPYWTYCMNRLWCKMEEKNDEDLNALQALVRQHQKTSFEFQLFFFLCLSVSLKHIFLMCPTLFNCRPHEKSYTLLWLWLYQQHRALKQHNIVQVQDDYKLFNDKETNKIQPTFFPHSHLEAFL